MNTYATYEFYRDTHRGKLAEEEFGRLVIKASLYLDKITFDRLAKVTFEEILNRASHAVCEMVDFLQSVADGEEDGKTVKSVSTDGYSVTYVTEADGTPSLTGIKLNQIAMFWLPVDLFYLGVDA